MVGYFEIIGHPVAVGIDNRQSFENDFATGGDPDIIFAHEAVIVGRIRG